jgi:glucosamine kinase
MSDAAALFIGIDGGGSRLRVALTDADLIPLAQTEHGAANPNSIGADAATARIRAAIRETLAAAGVTPRDVTAVGVGIAGASAAHSEAWLRETVRDALPESLIVPSSDHEIALVGAHGERLGALVLAGTGSVAVGINRAGEKAYAGGWGYLIGDEGSGCWIGVEALRLLARVADGCTHDPAELASTLPARLMAFMAVESPREAIRWVYGSGTPAGEVARLTEPVLAAAAEGDPCALSIVARAADALAALVEAVLRRLRAPDLPIRFAGGLLADENPLSLRLCERLNLSAFPRALHPPVIGGALLAKLIWKG